MRCVRRNPVRRGVVIVVTAVAFVVIVGFVALVIDLGRLLMVRTELQRVADSAAMAGASVYTVTVPINAEQVARSRAQAMSLANLTYGLPTNLAIADVVRGVYDFNNPAGGVVATGVEADYNACDVTVRCDGQINGTIPFLFAPLLGKMAGSVEATARAVFDDRVAGLTPAGALTPFVIELNTYNDQIVNGTDGYSFEPTLSATPDGVPEIHLFPSAGGGGNGNGKGTEMATATAAAIRTVPATSGCSTSRIQIRARFCSVTRFAMASRQAISKPKREARS